MSMITEFVKRLRKHADTFEKSGLSVDGIVKDYRESADVIEELSAKLQSANMERSRQYYNGGWIPVSERLPEKNMVCLVAVGEFNLTQMAMYSDLMGTIDHMIFYQGDYGKENFANITQYVKAWMPLPEPYKAESEEE